jgi:D-alanyl-D-alanine carboxypeptidase/D-alanyl-D-alanine-endopeptidase (penicillin-binding protein 4)
MCVGTVRGMRRATLTPTAVLCAAVLLPLGAAATAAAHAPTSRLAASEAPTVRDGRVAALASVSAVPTDAANARISEVLPPRARSKILGPRFTMTVWDTETRSYLYKRRAKQSLRGASTTKILTTVAVLATLGPDHRFPTTVRAGATPDEIILVGGGDPLLTSADLRALAEDTAAALAAQAESDGTAVPETGATEGTTTTRRITVRADDSLFAGNGISRGWDPSWVTSQVRRVGAFARDDRMVADATADAGAYFAKRLRRLDVRASYAGEALAAPDAPTLATFAGHSVSEAVSRALLWSDNDTAEMLFRQVAVGRGTKASWPGARRSVRDTLRELSIPLKLVKVVDGSGLSLQSRVSARALTAALKRAVSPRHPELSGLRDMLPVAGMTGTLQADYLRFTSSPSKCAAGLVQAKTGTLADAISLAGYASGADGRTKIFVSIVNGRPTAYSRLTTRQAVDRAVSTITGCW